ncbi:MAG: hypothetical protein IJJ82_07585 [Clostridia bacterium]|nr:hypothetical protein [Clostridia bacterium]
MEKVDSSIDYTKVFLDMTKSYLVQYCNVNNLRVLKDSEIEKIEDETERIQANELKGFFITLNSTYNKLEKIEDIFLKQKEKNKYAVEFAYILGTNELGKQFEDIEEFYKFIDSKAEEFLNSKENDYELFIIREAEAFNNKNEQLENEI